MNKKGAIELSMNTILIIVIGVVLLSLGLLLIRDIFNQEVEVIETPIFEEKTIIINLKAFEELKEVNEGVFCTIDYKNNSKSVIIDRINFTDQYKFDLPVKHLDKIINFNCYSQKHYLNMNSLMFPTDEMNYSIDLTKKAELTLSANPNYIKEGLNEIQLNVNSTGNYRKVNVCIESRNEIESLKVYGVYSKISEDCYYYGDSFLEGNYQFNFTFNINNLQDSDSIHFYIYDADRLRVGNYWQFVSDYKDEDVGARNYLFILKGKK